MKKSLLAIGLLSLVMVLTSFTTPETTNTFVNNNNTSVDVVNTGLYPNKKLDVVNTGLYPNKKLDVVNTGLYPNKKLDVVNTGLYPNKKLD